MRVWRLGRAKYLTTLDGEGARQGGGRWNHRGTALVYTSATLSLASIEYFVHLDPSDVPIDLAFVEIEVPDDATSENVDASSLSDDWRDTPGPDVLRDIGTAWQRARRTLVLDVPSAIITHERNYLLNPDHPEMARVIVGATKAFAYDARMFK
jgi:RES domain-containing protein